VFRLDVGIYGIPHAIGAPRQVIVSLTDGALLRDVIAALRREITGLTGVVISPDADSLTERYAFNVNGSFYYGDGGGLKLKPGDRIALLSITTGG
jgi:hypothetical protein